VSDELSTPQVRRLALATGLTYNVLEWGADHPGDTTVVLVHGFLDLARGWDEVPARLASRFHVIAPDLRGHGDSDRVGAGGYYHFFDYLPDLDEVITRLGRDRIAMVGHSMGGSVAAYWAGMRPARLRALALLEGIGPPEATTPLPDRAARWIDMWRAARGGAKVMATLDDAAARLRRHDPLLDEARARTLAAHGTRATAGGLTWKHDPLHLTQGPYPYRVDSAMAFWSRVAAPVLYVEGAESRFRLADTDTERRLAAFPSVRRAVIPGAGHMMQRHQPAAVADVLREHILSA
jgi:pimeloyl-ACP methyl ester carboxylesterase